MTGRTILSYTERERSRAASVPDHVSPADKYRWFAVLLTTFPTVLGVGLTVSALGGTFYYTDVLLPVAALTALPRVPRRRGDVAVLVAVLMLAIAFAVGLRHGAAARYAVRDGRAWIYLVTGFVVALDILQRPATRAFMVRTLAWYLGVCALLIAAATTLPQLNLVAGVHADVLYRYHQTGVQLSADRSQTPLNAIALAVLCAAVGYGLGVHRLPRLWFWLVVPCVVIVFLSYSRNGLLAVGAALVIGVLVGGKERTRMARVVRVLVSFVLLAVTLFVLQSVGVLSKIIGDQVNSYVTRVLQGLTLNALTSDAGIGWRLTETHLGWVYVKSHAVIGSGFGAPYRPHILNEPFSDFGGRLYMHNAYLGIMIKLGILGVALMLFVVLGSAAGARHMTDHAEYGAYCAALVGTLVSNVASPSILSTNFAAIFGVLLAVGWLARPEPPPKLTLRRSAHPRREWSPTPTR